MRKLTVRLGTILITVAMLVGPAWATSSLSFDAEGYRIDLEIGADQVPLVASVKFHHPNDLKGAILPPSQWVVETFDTERRVLILRYEGGTEGVGPFELSVHGATSVLTYEERRIRSDFGWHQ